MHHKYIIALGISAIALSSCAWMGFSEKQAPKRSIASFKREQEDLGSEVFRDEEAFTSQQTVNCLAIASGPVHFNKKFQFHFDLEQLNDSAWAERVSLGSGLEAYVNLWSFREYTLGLRNVRAPASQESRLTETKGIWTKSHEKTITDLSKVRFQAKLFYSAGGQSYEIRCPSP